jgi:hypothetical protein
MRFRASVPINGIIAEVGIQYLCFRFPDAVGQLTNDSRPEFPGVSRKAEWTER